ncbi:hypothetical protein ACFVHR_04800 [Streptomyces sp. NPDC127168]|uniref:hypothetical protein n=1 Tax=unclassified Streptomyces TaxID=2593676 RepID=UPI003624F2C1
MPTTPDFFQPGQTYRRGKFWTFQCLAVDTAPWDEQTRAVGFLVRSDGTGAVHGMTADDWANGWTPAPECPYCAAPADASGCRIPQHDPRCPTGDPNF